SLLVQRVARIRAIAGNDQRFMGHALRSRHFVSYLSGQKTATAVPHISPTDLRDYRLAVPPIAEQREISKLLDTWNDAIAAAEGLHANCLRQRQALAWPLLTGRRRLLAFQDEKKWRVTPHGPIPSDWSYPRIEEIAEEV